MVVNLPAPWSLWDFFIWIVRESTENRDELDHQGSKPMAPECENVFFQDPKIRVGNSCTHGLAMFIVQFSLNQAGLKNRPVTYMGPVAPIGAWDDHWYFGEFLHPQVLQRWLRVPSAPPSSPKRNRQAPGHIYSDLQDGSFWKVAFHGSDWSYWQFMPEIVSSVQSSQSNRKFDGFKQQKCRFEVITYMSKPRNSNAE